MTVKIIRKSGLGSTDIYENIIFIYPKEKTSNDKLILVDDHLDEHNLNISDIKDIKCVIQFHGDTYLYDRLKDFIC